MLEFVARVFRGWMNVLLWLILIGCVIGGFVSLIAIKHIIFKSMILIYDYVTPRP
jgi:hypothetical protein